jgi:VWFA-related protein
MNRRWLTIGVGLVLQGTSLVAGGRRDTEPAHGRQERPPILRSAVDVIAVDVQVIDRDGRPITGLGPEKFTVTINGRRHRVLTAEFVDRRTSPASPGDAATGSQTAAAGGGRVVMLAFDCISFSPGVVRGAIETTRRFVERLPPDDLVGLVAYPIGPDIEPTTDRSAVITALDSVVGQRDVAALTQFSLRPTEIIDISTEIPQEDGPILTAVARRECGDPIDRACVKRLSVEVTSAALYYESLANVSAGALRSLLRRMGALSGRKTLVLISGGLVGSDRPGGRPDINDLGTVAGREAARANTAVYTLSVDTAFQERYAAESRGTAKDPTNLGRDAEVRARWLEQFSSAAGGALFRVTGGSGEYAFNRILSETSSYYLLGVEPAEADRNGGTHEVKVRVDSRNSTVRSRRWIAMPKQEGVETAPATAASSPAKASPRPPSIAPLPPPALASEVQPFADTFERGDYSGLQRQLVEATDLANMIRALRASDALWPEAPRRAAVFALEVAVAGLHSDNGFARDQGSRLLAEYNTRVRHPDGADAFECTWLWTQLAALGGLSRPALAIGFVRRALLRCPAEPRFHLADALITEQQWWSTTRRPGEAETSDVVRRYEAAMKFSETELEARVRCASFLFRMGQLDRAVGLLDGASRTSSDTYVRYLAELVRGRVLHALGRTEEAIDAVRAALVAWPRAQSARVLLMTMLVARGDREGAAALAEGVETSADDEIDPWWTYWFGDFRAYPAIVARLRELAR